MDPGMREDPKTKRGSFAVYDMQMDSMDRINVLRENRFSDRTPYEVGQAMRTRHSVPWVWGAIICDPEDPAAPRDFCHGYGQQFPIIKFDKGKVQPGIREVHKYLRIRADSTTGLSMDPSCTDRIWEMLAYSYPDIQEGREISENPKKIYDHFPDCLRYFIIGYPKTQQQEVRVGPVRGIEEILAGY